MMNPVIIILWIWAAFIATSFWESYVEGRNAWDKHKYGWKVTIGKYKLTGYHFWLFFMMWPLLLLLPFVMFGWNTYLFRIVAGAFFSGLMIEDFFWFVVNPEVKLKEWSTRFTSYYPWIRIGKIQIPLGYVLSIIVALLFWFA